MTKNAKDKSIRYDQTKRIIELFLKDLKNSKQVDFYLESCNVCAASCAVEAVGATWNCTRPKVDNVGFLGSYADVMFQLIYLSSETPVRSDTLCENEIPVNLVWAINKMSTAKANLKEFNSINEMCTSMEKDLKEDKAIVISYLTDYGTGHYVCLVGIEKGKILAYDSWSANKHCKNNGSLEEYDMKFFKQRCSKRLRYISVEN